MKPEKNTKLLLGEIAQEVTAPRAERIPGTGIRFEMTFSYTAMGEPRKTDFSRRYPNLLPAWGGKVS